MGHARVPNFVSDRVQENALPFPVPIEVNQRDAAAVLGLTTRQIRNLDEAGIPSRPAGDGRGRVYDLVEVVPWYIREVRRQSRTNESDLDRAKLEQAELEVRRRRIEVAKAEGELIAIADHRTVVGKVADAFRAALLSVPGSWGPQIVGIPTPAEGTEAMRVCSEGLLRDMASVADALELEGEAAADPLPEDFPGYRALVAAGVETFAQLRALGEVTRIKGIGPKLAKRIVDEMEPTA